MQSDTQSLSCTVVLYVVRRYNKKRTLYLSRFSFFLLVLDSTTGKYRVTVANSFCWLAGFPASFGESACPPRKWPNNKTVMTQAIFVCRTTRVQSSLFHHPFLDFVDRSLRHQLFHSSPIFDHILNIRNELEKTF